MGVTSTQITAPAFTFPAGEDLSSYSYCACKLSSGQVVHCDTDGEEALGWLGDCTGIDTAGMEVPVYSEQHGIIKVKAGDAITAGANLKIQVTTGRAITADTAGDYIMAKALQAATATGSIIAAIAARYVKHA